jgi:hypothetical protein
MLRLLLLLAVSCASLQGCALQVRDYRDAPWDPPPGRALFEQLPNWDDAARRRCGAHLHEHQRSVGMSGRC